MSAESSCPCDNDLPQQPTNLPGLTHIAARAGTFAEFRRALLLPVRATDSATRTVPPETELSTPATQTSPVKAVWRPGAAGDLAVMMMEWWAYVGDILTFYNERIANQDYLRTADLPESVPRLIQLLGYRPRPAIGATGTLAALITPGQTATLPRGLPFLSKPAPGQEVQTFELDADTTIGPPDSVPANPPVALLAAQTSIGAGVYALLLGGAVTNVPAATPLLIVARATDTFDPAPPYLLTEMLGQATVQTIAGGQKQTRVVLFVPNPGGAPLADLTAAEVGLQRSTQSTGLWTFFPQGVINGNVVQLAGLARQLRPGDTVVFTFDGGAPFVTTVKSNQDVTWYSNATPTTPTTPPASNPLPVPHTQLTLGDDVYDAFSEIAIVTWLIENDLQQYITPAVIAYLTPYAFILGDNIGRFAILSNWIDVGALKDQPPAPYDGTPPTLVAVEPATFVASTGVEVIVADSTGAGVLAEGSSAGDDTLTLSQLPSPMPTLQPPLSVLYDLLPVSRGKTVANEVLGSGDATVAGQSFQLSKAPVTYLAKNTSYASTIALTVAGRPWTEVSTFYGQPPTAEVFVTREDESGKTHVDFGDGINGARLPTGANNVVASYRVGAGAASPPAGKLTVIGQSFPGLKSVLNPVAVGGGADPEPSSRIATFAPRSVLTLGRAVGVYDYQAIAAQAPGVARAQVVWAWSDADQRALVTVYVGDDAAARDSAQQALAAAGDPNRPVAVKLATPVEATLRMTLIIGLGLEAAPILAAVQAALTDPVTGLFSPDSAGIGQSVFDSQIEEVVLEVEGVVAISAFSFVSGDPSLERFGFRFGFLPQQPSHSPGEGGYFAPVQVSLSTQVDTHG
jgi:hypothetical protein